MEDASQSDLGQGSPMELCWVTLRSGFHGRNGFLEDQTALKHCSLLLGGESPFLLWNPAGSLQEVTSTSRSSYESHLLEQL